MSDDEATTALDAWAAEMQRLHCEPCESCGTSLMKRGGESVDYASLWQIETWAVLDANPEVMRFVEHTHEQCSMLVRINGDVWCRP